MERYNRYTRMNGKPNFYHFRVIKARYSSKCKCDADILSGSNVAWAKGSPAICMECYRVWEIQVREEQTVCDHYSEMMGGSW